MVGFFGVKFCAWRHIEFRMVNSSVFWIFMLEVVLLRDFGAAKPVTKSVEHSAYASYPTEASTEDCDWTGMTKPAILAGGSVQQEYLRCASGRIKWLYPEGALRVTVQTPTRHFPGQHKQPHKLPISHRVCLTVNQKTLQNVNVFLQNHDKLDLIFSPKIASQSANQLNELINQASARTDRSVDPDRRCLLQTGPVVSLYLEALLVEGLNFISATVTGVDEQKIYTRLPSVGAAEIHYDIRAM